MVNYKEEINEGQVQTWRRVNKIEIYNQYNKNPKITFNEIEQTILPDGQVTGKTVDKLHAEMFNPLQEFELLNPVDDSVIGVVNYHDLQVILYSLYMNLAKKRDLKNNPFIEESVTNVN